MHLPLAFYFTDDQRGEDPLKVAQKLPKGCGVVFRHYNSKNRANIAFILGRICKNRNLTLIVSKNPDLAATINCAGCHIPEHLIPQIPLMKARFPNMIFTAACHSERSLHLATKNGADAAFFSPIFVTNSHPNAHSRGAIHAALTKRRVLLPTYGLGGINAQNWKQLSKLHFSGFGAISSLENQEFQPGDLISRR